MPAHGSFSRGRKPVAYGRLDYVNVLASSLLVIWFWERRERTAVRKVCDLCERVFYRLRNKIYLTSCVRHCVLCGKTNIVVTGPLPTTVTYRTLQRGLSATAKHLASYYSWNAVVEHNAIYMIMRRRPRPLVPSVHIHSVLIALSVCW